MKTVIMRADAFEGIGTGHVMRCLALGQSLVRHDVKVVFISRCDPKGLIERIIKEGFDFISLKEEIELIKSQRPDWIVVDGVHFDETYHDFLRGCGCRVLAIDDMGSLPIYDVDIVVNQNLHAHDLHYNYPEHTRLLLGVKYVMLRNEFLSFLFKTKHISNAGKNLLITLGGIDKGNFTEKILKSIIDVSDLDITVVLGAGNPHLERIKAMKMASRFTILQNVTDMPALMSWADAAITSGGTTVWELAFMGVPSIVGRVATIEDYLVGGLNKHGLFVDAGWFETTTEHDVCTLLTDLMADRDMRNQMSIKGQQTVTGSGCQEVIKEMSLL
ncbi:MAG: UDP-2,4-diacetamido-2,4,6-trideoxy-beta-L-altropyranose hydrolase [Nitrospirae bacterium]|nr:UDP-2,4-diacetamido-2,4,6-trideoxy-beta-L-altropyranose hydrolase [Nitrospirota bacterium]